MDDTDPERVDDGIPSEPTRAETADGRIRWWRPDIQYRVVAREEDSGRLKALLVAAFFLLTGFQWNLLRKSRERELED